MIMRWSQFVDTYKEIKKKKIKTEEESDFLDFFEKIKEILIE